MTFMDPEKIVIRTPNWLGDLMMSTTFIHAVLDRYPQAQVDVIVKAGFEQIPLPHRGKILVFDKNKQSAGRFGGLLRKQAYDHFYILPASFSSAWMAFCSGATKRIGHVGEFRRWLLKPAKSYQHPPRTRHLVQEYLNLLDASFTPEQYLPRLNISEEWLEDQLKDSEPLPKDYVALATGAIYGPAKQWPVEHFQRLAKQFVEHQQFVVIVGTQTDYEDGEKVRSGSEHVSNRCGQTSLTELIAILAKTRLLISNDSGSMHLMSALQRPQIAIFGSTSPTWTGPLNPQAQTLYRALNCSPCFQRTCRFRHYDCLYQITPEQVFEQAHSWF